MKEILTTIILIMLQKEIEVRMVFTVSIQKLEKDFGYRSRLVHTSTYMTAIYIIERWEIQNGVLLYGESNAMAAVPQRNTTKPCTISPAAS